MSLSMEVLEPRVLLTAKTYQINDLLMVNGGVSEADTIVIRGSGAGNVAVFADPTGTDDVVSATPVAAFTGISKILVNTFGGNDVVVIDGVTISKNLTITAGGGNDCVGVRGGSSIGGKLTITGLMGNDVISLDGVSVGDDLAIDASFGSDLVTLNNVQVVDRTGIAAGAGNDVVAINAGQLSGQTKVLLGFGDDVLSYNNVNSSVGAGSVFQGGSLTGTDTLAVSDPANLPIAGLTTSQFETTVSIAELSPNPVTPFQSLISDCQRRVKPLLS